MTGELIENVFPEPDPVTGHLGDRVSAWLDDELDADERALADEHLVGCVQCRAVLNAEENVRTWVRSLPMIDAADGFYDSVLRAGPRDRRADRRRVRFGVANLVASAAVWVLVLGVGQLSARSTVEPTVGSFVTAHQSSVVGGSSVASAQTKQRASNSDLPSATERFQLVAFADDGPTTQAVYSDGTDVVSVFRQVGVLDRSAVDPDARPVKVGATDGLVLDRGQVEVLLFERGDYVYAVVAPPSSGVIDEIAVALPGSPSPSLMDRARDAGKGLLDAFALRG
jgi:anti-sigma factor RsiW